MVAACWVSFTLCLAATLKLLSTERTRQSVLAISLVDIGCSVGIFLSPITRWASFCVLLCYWIARNVLQRQAKPCNCFGGSRLESSAGTHPAFLACLLLFSQIRFYSSLFLAIATLGIAVVAGVKLHNKLQRFVIPISRPDLALTNCEGCR